MRRGAPARQLSVNGRRLSGNQASMPKKPDPVLAKMNEICLSLPDTKLTMPWGSPHFRVVEKIFAGCGEDTVSFRLYLDHADAVVTRPGFSRAPYVGHLGGVVLEVSDATDWDEVREFVLESYRIVAPKKSLAKLDGNAPATAAVAKKKTATRTTSPAKKKAAARTKPASR
jgi:hypothetical protein